MEPKKPRKVLYLVGNGFDIQQGLNTRYVDMFNYFLLKEPNSNNFFIQKYKNDLLNNQHIELWSDFERSIGVFTAECDKCR